MMLSDNVSYRFDFLEYWKKNYVFVFILAFFSLLPEKSLWQKEVESLKGDVEKLYIFY